MNKEPTVSDLARRVTELFDKHEEQYAAQDYEGAAETLKELRQAEDAFMADITHR